jgi:peroxiredoxin
MRNKLIALLALLLVAASAHAALTPSQPAPDFTLHAMSGSNLRLQEQRGRVVLVNFWATWCGPCREEMPKLNQLYEKYRSAGFVLLGVNVDDDPRNATAVATKLGVKFPVLLDTDKQVIKSYDVSTMPSTVLIDRDGRVRFLHRGYLSGYEDTYEKQIRELLKE